MSWTEQTVGQEHAIGLREQKALTDLLLNWGNAANNTVENGLQALGALGDLDATDCDVGGDPDRGGGCRAEEAEGEGSEDGEAERAHCEWVMSVG